MHRSPETMVAMELLSRYLPNSIVPISSRDNKAKQAHSDSRLERLVWKSVVRAWHVSLFEPKSL